MYPSYYVRYIYILNINIWSFFHQHIIGITGFVIKILSQIRFWHTFGQLSTMIYIRIHLSLNLKRWSNLYLKLDCIKRNMLAKLRYSIKPCNRLHSLYYVLFKSAITSICNCRLRSITLDSMYKLTMFKSFSTVLTQLQKKFIKDVTWKVRSVPKQSFSNKVCVCHRSKYKYSIPAFQMTLNPAIIIR